MENTAREIKKYTADEFYELGEYDDKLRELINGYITDLASPSIYHQEIAGSVFSEIKNYIKRNGGKCKPFIAPTDVKINDDSVVIPDIFIACDPSKFDKQKYNGAPDFIIEIVSTNKIDDYVRKLALYQVGGVREYWIVDPEDKRILIYFFEDGRLGEVHSFDEDVCVNIYKDKSEPLTININALLE